MKRILPFLLLGLPFYAAAQTVIATDGNSYQGEYNGLSWTIGETVVETESNDSQQLTQGFQQAWADITIDVDEPLSENTISVYPNPVRHVLHVDIDRPETGQRLELRDMAGKLVLQETVQSTMTDLNMEEYASGLYHLRVFAPNDAALKTFTISITK
ncbi:MAG: T9SS type A sorting domain-containing protein [Flavobacteriales bacterium]|nr:T9SS type A sorting domain-containing protein [Flavobacteriales bacterium]